MHFNPAQYPEPFQYFDAQSPTPSVEFTDLTSLHHEDRRKKRSGSVRDKQTISTMHMRRREQNRASQRAFRERKEKHTQELQQQLDEMKKKYQKLMKSYDDLGTVNAKMRAEMDELREKAKVSQSYEDDSLSNMDDSDIFYQLLSEEDLQADSKLEFES
ncbi:hypothetical protein MMC20_005749 [Loxospora ochrophaea]|nr:hypothetical protein [Loxospora ochrophaea]